MNKTIDAAEIERLIRRAEAILDHPYSDSDYPFHFGVLVANLRKLVTPTPKNPKIAIAGNLRSGKTTLATELGHALGLPVFSFAQPLKNAFGELGLPCERYLIQAIGSLVRGYDPDHFVNLMRDEIVSQGDSGMIIDDVRFPNELAMVKEQGFFTILLRPGIDVLLARGATLEDLAHESEQHVFSFDGSEFSTVVYGVHPVEDIVPIIMKMLEEDGFDCSNYTGGGVSDLAVGA